MNRLYIKQTLIIWVFVQEINKIRGTLCTHYVLLFSKTVNVITELNCLGFQSQYYYTLLYLHEHI